MATIKKVEGRKILNSRGDWTIEVSVKLSSGVVVTAAVPEGTSSGKAEAIFVKPVIALKRLEKIEKSLEGEDPKNQAKIDKVLIELDGTESKSNLGANAILGTSLAVARAAARETRIPLWKHLKKISGLRNKPNCPKLFINVINGGLHARNNLAFQEYLIIPNTREIAEAVLIGTRFYKELKRHLESKFGIGSTGLGDEGGFAPKFKNNLEPVGILKKIAGHEHFRNKILIGLDAAASNIKINKTKLFKIYKKLNLYYLEDPFDETDFESFAKLNREIGKKTLICGDDLTVTNPKLIKKARSEGSINCVIIKPNQIGTLTEVFDSIRLARDFKWKVIISHRSGETKDDFISDLAYAVAADGIKLGAPARGERIAKYNRLLEICG